MDRCGRRTITASVVVVALLFPVSFANADTFTSREFLTWDRSDQDYYFRTSIGMASLIAGRNDKEQGDCIDAWYFEKQEEAGAEIRQTMRQYPKYHPRGVILAFVEKRCGSLIY